MSKPQKPPDKAQAGIPLSSYSDYREARETSRPPASRLGAESLDEVDRAIALLDDRHPDTRRLERATAAALAKKKLVTEARAKGDQAADRRRWALRIGVGLVVVATAVAGWVQYSRRAGLANAVDAALAPELAPYLACGFARVAPSRFAMESIEFDVTEPTCFVAAASRAPGDGALVVERPTGALEGEGTVAWCTCGAEAGRARLRARAPGGGGIAVLRARAADLGGPYGLFWLEPPPHFIAPPDECSHEALDVWIDKGVAVGAKDDALDEELRGTLGRAGFTVSGSAKSSLPFAVVPGTADTCTLAWSTSPRDQLGLRLRGGDRPLADVTGPLGFCQSRAEPVTVWRKGAGDLVVERVHASRVGGTHGLHEVAPRLGLPEVATWISEDELAWDATATLRASGILPAEITVSTDAQPVRLARIVALSIAGATVLADVRGVGYSCEPSLGPSTRSAVCVQSTPLPWRTVGALGKAGIAEATLPFWMAGLADATDPPALAAELALAKLGRRLVVDGFDTSLEGFTEFDGGALVTGRGGSDGVVALQLTRDAPWVSPCSSGSGEVWTVDDDPAVVSLAPGAQAKLTCAPRGGHDRRTVVFRHVAVKPAPR